ncbi:hypothetical protein HDU93_008277 [Gonapodya sp. JEL0774]|nr:hypothetical protein HDU93_008277 [Gonapodya sp. JEL0774]
MSIPAIPSPLTNFSPGPPTLVRDGKVYEYVTTLDFFTDDELSISLVRMIDARLSRTVGHPRVTSGSWSNAPTRGFIHDRIVPASASGPDGVVKSGPDSDQIMYRIQIAVVWREGEFVAVTNTCPHAGVDLASGSLTDIEQLGDSVRKQVDGARRKVGAVCGVSKTGEVGQLDGAMSKGNGKGKDRWALVCPAHGWLFDPLTGTCLSSPTYAVDVFEVLVDPPVSVDSSSAPATTSTALTTSVSESDSTQTPETSPAPGAPPTLTPMPDSLRKIWVSRDRINSTTEGMRRIVRRKVMGSGGTPGSGVSSKA